MHHRECESYALHCHLALQYLQIGRSFENAEVMILILTRILITSTSQSQLYIVSCVNCRIWNLTQPCRLSLFCMAVSNLRQMQHQPQAHAWTSSRWWSG